MNYIVDVVADIVVDDGHFVSSFLLILILVRIFVVVIVWCAKRFSSFGVVIVYFCTKTIVVFIVLPFWIVKTSLR